MTKNFEALHAALDHLRMHPEQHHQDAWMRAAKPSGLESPDAALCGTVGCLAGWGVVQAKGLTFTFERGWSSVGRTVDIAVPHLPDGRVYHQNWESDAKEIFGLTDVEGAELFHPDNTFDDLEAIVKDWENEETTP